MTDTIGDSEKVTRATLPTASFSITVTHIAWIARRAKTLGISKSQLVRDLLDRAMEREGEKAA